MNDTTVLLPHIKLLLSIKHPSSEECYADGYECGQAELPEEQNPYAKDTSSYNSWLEGWWDGFYAEEPLFSLEGTDNESAPEALKAANDQAYHPFETFIESHSTFIEKFLKISSALAVTVVVGYQVLDLVA